MLSSSENHAALRWYGPCLPHSFGPHVRLRQITKEEAGTKKTESGRPRKRGMKFTFRRLHFPYEEPHEGREAEAALSPNVRQLYLAPPASCKGDTLSTCRRTTPTRSKDITHA
jgi:hypothetical protein